MTDRVTPDSNILISALVFGGNPLRLLEMALDQEVTLVISLSILEETLRVLKEKFDFTVAQLQQAKYFIEICTERVTAQIHIDEIKNDPDDNRVLECAMAGVCKFIVTGDQDLLRLKHYQGIDIRSVRSYLDRMSQ